MEKTYYITKDNKEVSCKIKEPQFAELRFAFSALMESKNIKTGWLDAGKCIFDTCKIECDSLIMENPNILLKLCLQIADDYMMTFQEDFKKK